MISSVIRQTGYHLRIIIQFYISGEAPTGRQTGSYIAPTKSGKAKSIRFDIRQLVSSSKGGSDNTASQHINPVRQMVLAECARSSTSVGMVATVGAS